MMPLDWRYNLGLRRWETTVNGWRLMVARWASGSEWTAAIEALDRPNSRYAAPHNFLWVEDAQAWCVAQLSRDATMLTLSTQARG
jgi:hypothetical protein